MTVAETVCAAGFPWLTAIRANVLSDAIAGLNTEFAGDVVTTEVTSD